MWIQSLMQRAKPSKIWVTRNSEPLDLDLNGRPRNAEPGLSYPDLTDNERTLVANALLPASRQLIITLLARLAVHKRMEQDRGKQEMLFKDYSELLYGFPEYALALAVFDMIENDQSDWFPNLAKLREKIGAHMVNGVVLKPDNMENS
ncbi:hypothetical protein [Larkinella harenae]